MEARHLVLRQSDRGPWGEQACLQPAALQLAKDHAASGWRSQVIVTPGDTLDQGVLLEPDPDRKQRPAKS